MVTVVSYGLPVQSKEKDPFVKGIMEVAAAGLVSVSLIVMQQRHSNASVSQVDALQWTFKMKLAQGRNLSWDPISRLPWKVTSSKLQRN